MFVYMFCNLVLVPDVGSVLSYITLGVTEGVTTQSVPVALDGVSLPIYVDFPFGAQIQSTVYVC